MRSSKIARAGAMAYVAFSAAQQWASNLVNGFPADSVQGYVAGKVGEGSKIGAIAAGAIAIDRFASSIDDFVTPYALRATKGILPLAAATVGVGYLLNNYGSVLGLPEGYGTLEMTKHLVLNYRDSLIDLFRGNPLDSKYLVGAAVVVSSALRLGKNMAKTAMESGERKRQQQEYRSHMDEQTVKYRGRAYKAA